MISRKPAPLAVRDQVRILPHGKIVWRVHRLTPEVVELINERSKMMRYIARDIAADVLTRVTGIPISDKRTAPQQGTPTPLSVHDRVKLSYGNSHCVWRVTEIDDLEVRVTYRQQHKHLPWSDIYRGKAVRVNRVPILEYVNGKR